MSSKPHYQAEFWSIESGLLFYGYKPYASFVISRLNFHLVHTLQTFYPFSIVLPTFLNCCPIWLPSNNTSLWLSIIHPFRKLNFFYEGFADGNWNSPHGETQRRLPEVKWFFNKWREAFDTHTLVDKIWHKKDTTSANTYGMSLHWPTAGTVYFSLMYVWLILPNRWIC